MCGSWISVSTRPPLGAGLKLLNVIDEFTREALAIHVDHSIDGVNGTQAVHMGGRHGSDGDHRG